MGQNGAKFGMKTLIPPGLGDRCLIRTSSRHMFCKMMHEKQLHLEPQLAFENRPFSRSRVGGIPFEIATLDEASSWLIDSLASGSPSRGIPIRLSNAYCVALAQSHREYRSVFTGEGMTFADGAPVAWFQRRFLRGSVYSNKAGRVRGPSFFTTVLDRGQQQNLRHFFLGSTNETLDLLEAELKSRYPAIRVSGKLAPPFGPVDEKFIQQALRAIELSDAQIVWIGMGTPKQDHAATELAQRASKIFVGVGAAFDFVAGTVPEAHPLIQRSGFEWLYRLAKEPRRLGKRYLLGNTQFLLAVFKHRRDSRESVLFGNTSPSKASKQW